MLARMSEPAPEAPSSTPPAGGSDGAADLPLEAYTPPSVVVPARPALTRTYELPTARRVVSAGLQLALASTVPIRGASIYIGLLFLGAFGPAVILFLVALARLLNDPESAALLNGSNPFEALDNPALASPTLLIAVVATIGAFLFIAISIDARAIAIAILGGASAERPISLPEAIARARQTFWRLLGATVLIGIASSVISLVVAWPFLRPFDSNQGVNFIASMIATLALSPFAYASAGIVLGDVDAVESLRRSVRLFRAKPRIGLVVTLFTLVSAAIQTFALGAGLDVATRVADFFHIAEGPASLILPGILVLAFIVAFGSLTFTIAAIVVAPQVAAFLGLTFYAGGLDRARLQAGAPAAQPAWVSLPMGIAIAFLGFATVIGIPAIASIRLH
jgi:hypothetical protein